MSGLWLKAAGTGGSVGSCHGLVKTSRLLRPAASGIEPATTTKTVPVRHITDIPHYERVEYSHLHDFGQKSELVRFKEKIQKLEEHAEFKAKYGTDGSGISTVLPLHKPTEKPPGWKPVQLPNRIKRSPSAVLRAMASVVGKDDTAPAYQFHDDPYLIPYNSMRKIDYVLSKDSGRKAARYVLDRHPELFEKNLIEMQPKIKAFMPRLQVTEKNANVELLANFVDSFSVPQAIETYKHLQNKGEAGIEPQLKQKLLELVCYHNEREALDEDFFREQWQMTTDPDADLWAKNTEAVAESILNEILEDADLDQKAKIKANLTLACAYAKFNLTPHMCSHIDEAYRSAKEAAEAEVGDDDVTGDLLDLNVFNAVIQRYARNTSGVEDPMGKAKEVLADMKTFKVKPDQQTLVNYLSLLSTLSAKNRQMQGRNNGNVYLEEAMSALNEFRNVLGVEPSLGAYLHVAKINPMAIYDVIEILEKAEAEANKDHPVFEVKTPADFDFFLEAVGFVRMADISWAYRLHALAVSHPEFLGGFNSQNFYHQQLMYHVVAAEPIDVAMRLYERLVPHTLTPNFRFYKNLVQELNPKQGIKHLARIWTDLQAGNMLQTGTRGRMEIYHEILSAMASSPDVMGLPADARDEEANRMFGGWVVIAREILEDVQSMLPGYQERRGGGRQRAGVDLSSPDLIKVLNGLLEIFSSRCVEVNEASEVRGQVLVASLKGQSEVIEICQRSASDLSGHLNGQALSRCMDNYCDGGGKPDRLAAKTLVIYAIENRLESSKDLALRLVGAFRHQLDDIDRNELNSLLSYDTEWTPI